MYRTLEYALLFVILILLQVFLFGNIGISLYVNSFVYVAFIILLPMEIPGALLLLLAMLTGVTMDFFMATAGINTIATLFMAFCRPTVLSLLIGKDEVREGGVPNVNRLGIKKFFRYAFVMILLHNAVFFIFESLTWRYFHVTLIRIVVSSLLTLLLVYFCQKLFSMNRRGRFMGKM